MKKTPLWVILTAYLKITQKGDGQGTENVRGSVSG